MHVAGNCVLCAVHGRAEKASDIENDDDDDDDDSDAGIIERVKADKEKELKKLDFFCFIYVLYWIVSILMTLSDPEPQFQGHSIV